MSTTIQKKPELVLQASKPTLILTSNIQKQIDYAHKVVGAIEWSGFLLFKKESGDLFNGDLVLKAHHFFPLDVGTTGYTEFEADVKILDMWDNIPNAEEYLQGFIHTH